MMRLAVFKSSIKTLVKSKPPAAYFAGAFFQNFTTYSGGQPSEGQGGFYSAIRRNADKNASFKPGSRAEEQDLLKLDVIIQKWEDLQAAHVNTNAKEEEDKVWREILNPDTKSLVDRLHVKDAPVWGLSVSQREFLKKLQAKTNARA